MTWLNTTALLVIFVVAAVEAWRKFGRAVFDVVGGLLSVKIAHLAQPGLASLVQFSADPDANQVTCFAVVFVLLAALTVVASKYLYAITLLSLPDAFEGVAGAVLGLVSGVVVAHAIAWAAFTSDGGVANKANRYAETVAVRELVDWDTYQQALYHLKHLGE